MSNPGGSSKTRIVLTEEQVKVFLADMQDKVREGDYYIHWERDKNKALKETYQINDAMARAILLSLESGDYYWAEKSDNALHPDDIVNVYKVKVNLLRKDTGESGTVELYIKFAHEMNNARTKVEIVGFHEDNIVV